MARTYQEQLDDVDAAIAKIERLGQSHQADGGAGLTRADIGKLYEERKRLENLVGRATRGGISVTSITPVDG
jgi:hypothetical protein